MVELWFQCLEYYPYIQMWQYMRICGVGAKLVTHLMQYHLLQWEQKTPKVATTKIQVKRYERYTSYTLRSLRYSPDKIL